MDCTVLILACHVAVRNVNLSKNVIRDRMRTNAKPPSSFDLSTQGAFRHSIERRSPVFWQRSVIHTITAVKLKKKKNSFGHGNKPLRSLCGQKDCETETLWRRLKAEFFPINLQPTTRNSEVV